MPISHQSLVDLFRRSIDQFIAREIDQILVGVNERNHCGRLAIYMQDAARDLGPPQYFADPEYNRKQDGRIKTIIDENLQVVTINCDLILHSRGAVVAGDNLIAIEMKKSERPNAEKESDRIRLRALTKSSFDDVWSADGNTHPERVCGYQLGSFIELNRRARTIAIEYYRSGAKYDEEVRAF